VNQPTWAELPSGRTACYVQAERPSKGPVTKPGLILGTAWDVGASGFSRAIKIMLQDKAKRMLR